MTLAPLSNGLFVPKVIVCEMMIIEKALFLIFPALKALF